MTISQLKQSFGEETQGIFTTTGDASINERQVGPLKESVAQSFFAAKEGLELVEKKIAASLSSDAKILSEISEYLLRLGGKRVRPLVCILTARLYKKEKPFHQLIEAAAGIEMIHMATLLHDDIIDESPKRRNQQSAYGRFGLTPSLLAGDFLLARAFGLCAHLDTFVIEATEKACVELTEGEVLEGKLTTERNLSFDEYITIVKKKTASLFALAASVGGHLSGASDKDVEHLRLFGYNAGIAFQIVDDILDITADEDLLGKPSGTDLRQRTPSIVNILWLASGDSFAKQFFSGEEPSKESTENALREIKKSSIIDQCREHAEQYARLAKEALESLAESDINAQERAKLLSIVEYSLERCR